MTLVTGAGGFIGSALAKLLASGDPQSLILLDSSEQSLFQLRRCLPLSQAILGSVEDQALLHEIFTCFRPETVFHAAAFKHVELLELNHLAAAANNVLGTHALLLQAKRHNCRSLVLVSTDKAVKPKSVMGVTKRIAELLAISQSRPNCRMNAVRLCNVTGSTGSVVPIFKHQIANGEPLTVTDANATRYFLPVDEAVAALLAAASSNLDGNIFLPEFGPPVGIMDLANSLMNGTNLPIEIIGLRAGEKLAEDLIAPYETQSGEFHHPSLRVPMKVLCAPRFSTTQCAQLVESISHAVSTRNLKALIHAFTTAVPEYQPSGLVP